MCLVIKLVEENLVDICDQQLTTAFLNLNIASDIQMIVFFPSLDVLILIPSKLKEQYLL
jgi:hypothetical protein